MLSPDGMVITPEGTMWPYLLSFLTKYESVAVWLEGIALIAIFFLDLWEYRKQGEDRKEQHKETLKQMRIMENHADSALKSLRLLQEQWLEERHRDLMRAISVLDEIRLQSQYWKDISDRKWGQINQASSIMPADSNIVLIQAGRHSKDLRNEVRDAFQMVANAESKIGQFYSQQQNYRQENLMEAAHLNLVNAEPKLTHIIGVFERTESVLRRRDSQNEGQASSTDT